jgi:multiple sugar transport system permease protein
MIIPFLWMISTSLKPLVQVFVYPPQWIPRPILWSNYSELWQEMPFGRFALNSTKMAVSVTLGQLLTCSLAGYSFARIRFPGRDVLFLAYLATMMVPGQVTMIPMFILMRELHWIDTHYALIVPALTSAFGTFLMRQFFLGLPVDLEDAAKLDGCNPLDTYWRIALPLSRPILATLAVSTFMGVWNDFLWPLIMINTESKRTLTLGLASLIRQYTTDWTYLMAGSVMMLLPIVVLFFIAQNYFVQGISLTGMKG